MVPNMIQAQMKDFLPDGVAKFLQGEIPFGILQVFQIGSKVKIFLHHGFH
jgi:hypothetical protein